MNQEKQKQELKIIRVKVQLMRRYFSEVWHIKNELDVEKLIRIFDVQDVDILK